jgi:hypothetical protein
MEVIDMTEYVAERRQATRSHFIYKDGAREATKDIMEYLQEQGFLCKIPGPVKAKQRHLLCEQDQEVSTGRVACGELHTYLNNLYYTAKTRYFVE